MQSINTSMGWLTKLHLVISFDEEQAGDELNLIIQFYSHLLQSELLKLDISFWNSKLKVGCCMQQLPNIHLPKG